MDLEALLEDDGATSFAFAVSEDEAISLALAKRPDVITSDVKLTKGSGPDAVREIHKALGMIPVIFITATPDACDPCEPPGVVLSKPINAPAVIKAFHSLQL